MLSGVNSRVSPGASSTGEGVIVSLDGSVLGMGSDVGGSIRDPAACNGVCGFKPTSDRVRYCSSVYLTLSWNTTDLWLFACCILVNFHEWQHWRTSLSIEQNKMCNSRKRNNSRRKLINFCETLCLNNFTFCSQVGMVPLFDGQNLGKGQVCPLNLMYQLRYFGSNVIVSKVSGPLFPVVSSYGPLAKDMSSIVLTMRALWHGPLFELDRTLVPLKFDEKVWGQEILLTSMFQWVRVLDLQCETLSSLLLVPFWTCHVLFLQDILKHQTTADWLLLWTSRWNHRSDNLS